MPLALATGKRKVALDHAPPKRRRWPFHPTVEALEDRCVPAGVIFTENFTDDLDPDRPGFDTGLDGYYIQGAIGGDSGLAYLPDLVEGGIPLPDANQASFPWALALLYGENELGVVEQGSYVATLPGIGEPDGLLPGEEIALAKVSVYGNGRVTFVGATGRTSTVDVFAFQGWQFVSRASGFQDELGQKLGGIVEVRVETTETTVPNGLVVVDDVTVTIGLIEPPTEDSDGDGVLDAIENSHPNKVPGTNLGDGNGDGIADSLQDHVASLPNAVDGRYVTLEVAAGTRLSNVRADQAVDPPAGVQFPVGIFSFAVLGVTPGGSTQVKLHLPGDLNATSYYRFGPTPDKAEPHWYSFRMEDGVGAILGDTLTTLDFKDGGFGDDDLLADGIIVDGGGPASGNGSIQGVVWNDVIRNGMRDAGEPGLPGVQLFLDSDNNGFRSGMEPVVASDATGAYSFTNLAPDSYDIGYEDTRLFTEQNFVQTAPSGTRFQFSTITAGEVPRAALLAIGDFNGDGLPDVAFKRVTVVENQALPRLTFYLNRPATPGSFALTSTDGFTTLFVPGMVSGDFDGDGVDDLALGFDQGTLVIQRGDRVGNFDDPATYDDPNRAIRSLAAGDLNGDGLADLIMVAAPVSNPSANRLFLLFNNPFDPGSFLPPVELAPHPNVSDDDVAQNYIRPETLVVADLNRDGLADIASLANGTGSVLIALSNTAQPGSFVLPPVSQESGWGFLVAGDINRDGLIDLVVGNETDTLKVLLNDSNQPGTFLTGSVLAGLGGSHTTLAVGDYNGDGFADLVRVWYDPAGDEFLSIYFNSPTQPGTFPTTDENSLRSSHFGFGVAAVDFNRDSLLDIVLVDRVGGPGSGLELNLRVGLRGNRVRVEADVDAELNIGLHQPPDADSDGVRDAIEDGVGNRFGVPGDGNNDGVPDSQQAGVVSLPTYHDNGYITFDLASFGGQDDYELVNVRAVPNPSPQDVPFGVTFPWGFFDFEITGLLPGDSAVLDVYFHGSLPVPSTFWKYGQTLDDLRFHWYNFAFDSSSQTGAGFSGAPLNRATIFYRDGRRGDDDVTFNGVIRDAIGFGSSTVPSIESMRINDGSPQRSKINSLTVTFTDLVTIDPGVFVLKRSDGSRIGLSMNLAEVAGQTVATLTFSGRGLRNGSLSDGRYSLTIKGGRIHSISGLALDADADGLEGGKSTESFFALFGDSDGDGEVDRLDRAAFLTLLGARRGDARYLWYFDWDGDGRVTGRDAKRVR